MPNHHPSAGARFLLERRSVDGDIARYDAGVYTPDERFDYDAELTMDGEVSLSARGERAGPDLEKKLATIAKLVARSAKKKLSNHLPPWPHRVLRWRGPGRGS